MQVEECQKHGRLMSLQNGQTLEQRLVSSHAVLQMAQRPEGRSSRMLQSSGEQPRLQSQIAHPRPLRKRTLGSHQVLLVTMPRQWLCSSSLVMEFSLCLWSNDA